MALRKGFKITEQDICLLEDGGQWDLIFHLASRTAPEEYQAHPIDTLRANSLGTLNVAEFSRKRGIPLIYTSTSEIYGEATVIPTPESHWGHVNPVGLRSCYDASKRFSEALLMAYHRQHGLDVRIVRIFNTYGPRMRTDGAYARVIPRFISQCLSDENLTIHGDGSQTRSFCYVSDIIKALLKVAECEDLSGEILNLGNPTEISILKLALSIRERTGSHSQMTFTRPREDDPQRRSPDITKAKEKLKWSPLISLDKGLQMTIYWYQSQRPKARQSLTIDPMI